MAVDGRQIALRRRVARLSLLTVGLLGLALVLLLVAVWVALRANPKDIVGQLPLGADDDVPSVSLFVAAGAAAASVFVGLAALHAAAAMRVLARDRRIPPPLSPGCACCGGPSWLRWVRRRSGSSASPSRRPSKLPDEGGRPQGPLRLTVLVPAHDESAHDRGHVGVVVGADPAAGQGGRRGRQLHRRHGRDRATTRRRGLHHGRQHRQEGRRAQPGAVGDVCRHRRARRRDDHGRGLGDRPRVPRDGDGAPRGRPGPHRRRRRLLRRGRRAAWSASCSATSTPATSATSPVVSARSSCSRAPRRCSAPTR